MRGKIRPPRDLPEPIGAVCPYCNEILDKRPQRKKKCPHCGNYIYVRSVPSRDGHKVLVTEDGAKEIDLESRRVDFREKWMQSLRGYGLSDRDFDKHRKILRERFGEQPADRDVVWSLFHEALEASMKSGDLQRLKMLYFEMALFLYEEGREFFHLLEQSRRMELAGYKQRGLVDKVRILAGDDSCGACRKLGGKILTLDEALEQMPIPCNDCTFDFAGTGQPGWCRCLYSAVVD